MKILKKKNRISITHACIFQIKFEKLQIKFVNFEKIEFSLHTRIYYKYNLKNYK